MLKVLHYTCVYAPAWKWGGPPRSIAGQAEGLAGIGTKVTVFTTNAGLENNHTIPLSEPVNRNGVEVNYFPANVGRLGIRSPALEAAVRARIKQFDLLHVTGVWQPTSVAACRAAEAAGIPYVVSPRGALSPYSFGQKRIKKLLYWWMFEHRNCDRAAGVHYTSSLERNEASRLKLRGRPFTIPNAIDLKGFFRDEQAGQAWRKSLGLSVKSASKKIFLSVGRLHHKKGLDLLPPVLAQLKHADWHWVLVGDDEDGTKPKLLNSLDSAGIRSQATFLPMAGTDAVRAAYSGADLLLMPSRHENFGNVAVESLACGCPVLLSDRVGAAGDLRKVSGVTVAPRDAADWMGKIAALLDQPAVVDAAWVRDRFSSKGLAEEMLAAYSETVR